MGEIARFFNFSPKRQRLLDKAIGLCDSPTKAKKLKDVCTTRWVERIDSYAVFLELLPSVLKCLQAIVHPGFHTELGTDWSWDGETITKANGFLFQLESSSFLIAFEILLQVLQVLREVTMKLQMKVMDVLYAYMNITTVVSTLNMLRQNSTNEFKRIFTEAQKLGKQLHGEDYELCTPRLTGRQLHRNNPPAFTPGQRITTEYLYTMSFFLI